jgi:hypothetical protein
MRSSSLSVAAVLLLLASACVDDPTSPDPSLPQGTLGTILNGESWSPARVAAQQQDGFSGIWADEGSPGSLTLLLQVPNLQGTGTFAFGEEGPLGPRATLLLGSGADQVAWRADGDQGSGTVTITELTDERLVGTFEFEAVADQEETDPQVITATQGSFDVPYSDP